MKLISKLAISAGIAGIAALAVVAPASAATSAPEEQAAVEIAPGNSGNIGVAIWNQFGNTEEGNVVVSMKAPTNGTFVADRLWGTDYVQGVASAPRVLSTDCARSEGDTVISCNVDLTIQPAANGQQSGIVIQANTHVDALAAADTTYGDGVFTVTGNGGITAGTGALQFRTPAVADTPIVAPAIALGAGALAAGGAAVRLIRRKKA
jgi:hypothetical protein